MLTVKPAPATILLDASRSRSAAAASYPGAPGTGKPVVAGSTQPRHPARGCSPTAPSRSRPICHGRVQLADGRTRAFVTPAGRRAGAQRLGSVLVEIHASTRARARRRDEPSRGSTPTPARGDAAASAQWSAWRAAARTVAAHRARVEAARAGRLAAPRGRELTRLQPQAGRKRRWTNGAPPCAADKVAEDLRDAHDAVAASARRSPRCRRRCGA